MHCAHSALPIPGALPVTLQRRIRSHDDDAGERTGELHDHPLGCVGRPDRDPFARSKASGQCKSQTFAVSESFGVTPGVWQQRSRAILRWRRSVHRARSKGFRVRGVVP